MGGYSGSTVGALDLASSMSSYLGKNTVCLCAVWLCLGTNRIIIPIPVFEICHEPFLDLLLHSQLLRLDCEFFCRRCAPNVSDDAFTKQDVAFFLSLDAVETNPRPTAPIFACLFRVLSPLDSIEEVTCQAVMVCRRTPMLKNAGSMVKYRYKSLPKMRQKSRKQQLPPPLPAS